MCPYDFCTATKNTSRMERQELQSPRNVWRHLLTVADTKDNSRSNRFTNYCLLNLQSVQFKVHRFLKLRLKVPTKHLQIHHSFKSWTQLNLIIFPYVRCKEWFYEQINFNSFIMCTFSVPCTCVRRQTDKAETLSRCSEGVMEGSAPNINVITTPPISPEGPSLTGPTSGSSYLTYFSGPDLDLSQESVYVQEYVIYVGKRLILYRRGQMRRTQNLRRILNGLRW